MYVLPVTPFLGPGNRAVSTEVYMQQYVLGFAFNKTGSRVTMIIKNRPVWQAGKLNGVGGKVEPGETYVQAMSREFREEASVDLPEDRWRPLAILQGPDFTLSAFHTTLTDEEREKILPGTDERLVDLDPADVKYYTMVPSTSWLLFLAMDPNVLTGKMAVPIFEYE